MSKKMNVSSSHHDVQPSPKRRCTDNNSQNDGTKKKILPVTLLSGFLGAGKTTLLKQILQSKNSKLKIAVIVNDMGQINLDAEEIKKHKLIQEKQEMVEMHNGCICCTLRGDLLKTVKQLAEEQKYDYLVVESTGISEPLPVAQTFVMDVNGEGRDHENDEVDQEQTAEFEPLSKHARMDTLVTVLDTFNFASILGNIESESDREKFFGGEGEETEESEESIVQLLIDQIEFANVIILNKIDLLPDGGASHITAIRALLHKLNPKARIVIPDKPKFERFDVDTIINTGIFDMEEAQSSAGWIAELEKPYHTPETEEYGIGSFVFRNCERPFHPERLASILKDFGTGLVTEIAGKKDTADENTAGIAKGLFSRVVRCKGELWLSNADCCPINVHSAGRQLEMEPAGNGKPWIGKVVEVHPNGDPEKDDANEEDCGAWAAVDLNNDVLEELKATNQWTKRFGDRRSELVLIGIKLDKERILRELENALLNDEEFNVAEKDRKKVWANDMEDPFFDGVHLWNLEDVMGEEDSQDVCEVGAAGDE